MSSIGFRSFAAVATFALSLWGTSAPATTVTPLGVDGVDFQGKRYNVSFVDGSCASVFSGCDDAIEDFQFSFADTVLALATLRDTFLAAHVLEFPVFVPVGCAGLPITLCQIAMPVYIHTGEPPELSIEYSTLYSENGAYWAIPGQQFSSPGENTEDVTFAVWTPVAAVPLPASGVFLVAGLAGLAALGRRKEKTV